jgi:prophage DNA circulation protein
MSTDEEEEKKPRFDASLPKPYKENWREAYRADAGESPRMASYQAPGGGAIPFLQKGFRFFGGQSQDTAEYPFGGLWSNEYLNEKPQSITVEGYLRGPAYIAQRNKLIESLRVPTDDDNPGYLDLPFWGRFPVVVGDNYEVSENIDEQGQCAVSIPFIRAGVSITDRLEALPPAGVLLENATANLQAAAIDDFTVSLAGETLDNATFASGFSQLKNTLLDIIGRIQGEKTALNAMTGEVLGIINLINQGIRAPRELARALFNAGASIVGGIVEIKNSIAMYGQGSNTASDSGSSGSGGSSGGGAASGGTSGTSGSASSTPSLPPPDNEKNTLVPFLSASTYTLATEAVTVSQEATKTAIENLYRTMAFLASARIIENQDSLTYKKAEGYWRLLEKLEESISRENPAVYAAMRDLRTALSRELSQRELSAEMVRKVSVAAPLLYLAYYLGCDEDKIRELNSIADSFVVDGAVIYV